MNRILPVAALFGVAVTACSAGGDAQSVESTPTTVDLVTTVAAPSSTSSTTTSTALTTTTLADAGDPLRMPLTGTPVDDASEIPDRPALVVKISNYPQGVVPQSGLNDADLVIEEIINDGATRLAVVFHSTESDPVGPIRSGRAQDIDLLRALDRPLFAWSGGNPAVTRAVEDSDLINLDARYTSGYYRRSGRSDANTLYSSTDVLWGLAPDEAGRPGPLFDYLDDPDVVEGGSATQISVTLDDLRARWIYDPESGQYLREQQGQSHTTEQNGEVNRVRADNVVVMMADYGINPSDGNPDAQVLGSNPVFVFSRGTVRIGSWIRFEPTDPIDLVVDVETLEPIGLVPGRTWLEIPRNIDGVLTWS
ncbi:MAG: DUF3048 domain-containing protein [Ilumatobacteraceae bacterium]